MKLSVSTIGAIALMIFQPVWAASLSKHAVPPVLAPAPLPLPPPPPPPPSGPAGPSCVMPHPMPDLKASDIRNIGFVLFRNVDVIDVFGTIDPFAMVASTVQQLNLHFIAETMAPVTTQPQSASMNRFNSSFWSLLTPTNTFDEDLDLDVLIVPGGGASRAPNIEPITDYLKKMFPRVKIFMTVCTGSGVAARAGVLDGRMVTTNKRAWNDMLKWGPNVKWVSPARYVVDGKVWSSSGVTSTFDQTFAFIEKFWGTEVKNSIAGTIEHVPRQWDDDPFAVKWNVEPTVVRPCNGTQP